MDSHEDRELFLTILRKLLKAEEKPVSQKGSIGMALEQVDVDSPHGVYRYDKQGSRWILISVDDEDFTKVLEPGYYVAYFDNTKCPACRVYDIYWFPFVKLLGEAYPSNYLIVLCDWFSRECSSRSASNAFEKLNIHASPTTAIFRLDENKQIQELMKVEGVKRMDELAKILDEYFSKKRSGASVKE
ncbi:hypothetical protein ACSU1N_06650 [Thermogladius sp. 4427co]|uniref:hypothetical protein n=1 Tax=Thermogladius sp. 4427co TaxID=3450718 RepID=UPI003F7917C4